MKGVSMSKVVLASMPGKEMPQDVSNTMLDAWAVLESYRGELLAQARVIISNPEDAEDVVQQTFFEAVRNTDCLSTPFSLGAWLRSLNRCNALDRLRGRRNDSVRIEGLKHLEKAFTTGGFSLLELREAVRTALEGLPPKLRDVVRLRYFEHLSHKEISARLGISIRNVNAFLMDASVRLFTRLKRQM
jgi:RNA polymerase sigma factor (sigma-70 family)